jgi:predicted ferric reductase
MITTIVLFLASAAYRLAIFAFNNPILHVATTTILSHDVVKLSIPTTAIRWQPGQHIFLRFLGLRPFESHPFSFATMPKDHLAQVRTMEFIVRPQSGFTRALFDHVRKTGQKEFAVLIDGPYGGVGSDLRAFHSVLICAGGSGITWAMSCLQDTIQGPRSAKQAIKLVWAVPNPGRSA